MQTASTNRKKTKPLRKLEEKLPEYNASETNEESFIEKLREDSVDSVEGSQTESPVPANRPARKPAGII